MKLKCFGFGAVLFVAGTAWGQSTAKTEPKDSYAVETNYWENHWFVSMGAGALIYFGDHNKQMKAGERFSPALDVAVGKWLTQNIGLRLMYSGLSAKGVTQNFSHSTGEVYDARQALYKQKFDLANIHADVLFNLSNLLFGYNEERFYSLSPYAGLGWMVTWDKPRADELGACVGLLNTCKLLPQLDLYFDIRSTVINDRMDGEVGGRNEEGVLSVTLGVVYKLPYKNKAKEAVQPMNEVELAIIRERLQAMDGENDSLRQCLVNNVVLPVKESIKVVEKEKVVTYYSSVVAPYLVTFPLGKSILSKEIRVNLGFQAKLIKESPETAVYSVTGYADKGSGSFEVNERLSLQRAQAVYDCLVSEHGLAPERLKVKASGGVENMFYNDASLNRAVIVQVIVEK